MRYENENLNVNKNEAVLMTTPEEVDAVCTKLEEMGEVMCNGVQYRTETEGSYRGSLCFDLSGGMYCYKYYFQTAGNEYTIIPAAEWLARFDKFMTGIM